MLKLEVPTSRARGTVDELPLAWQGWRLQLPSGWNPVKIEGDFDSGALMIADMERPRLGLRWRRVSGRLDADTWAAQAMRDEVGQLAAEEAREFSPARGDWRGSRLYVEPDPPGRDVWLARSPVSDRCLEVVYQSERRQNVLAGQILPTLADSSPDRPLQWAVFDLCCASPAGMKLVGHRLNAGDLSLLFEARRAVLTIRQIALASLALKRLSLERWLEDQESRRRRYFRATGNRPDMQVTTPDGRELTGVVGRIVRRRRFWFMRSLPGELLTCALHDKARDRLVIVQASDESMLRAGASSVGWVEHPT